MKARLFLICMIALLIAACSSAEAGEPPVTDTGIDPDAWALVPAGEFLMGQFEKPTAVDYDYEIMVTLVTNAQYAEFLNAALADETIHFNDDQTEVLGFYPGDEFHGYRHEERIDAGDWLLYPVNEEGARLNFASEAFAPKAGYENHPVTFVTWFGARAYCDYTGGRLPSGAEWEKAARGTEDARPYAWGFEVKRSNANFYASRDPFEKSAGKQGDTTPVGYYNGNTYGDYETIDSPSPYGVYDMGGNVWQWTSDVYARQHYRYMRGGSKGEYEHYLRVWMTNNAAPYFTSPGVGFRCVRDVNAAE